MGKTITKYAEPFIGGGAVFFDILSSYQLEEFYISDINFDLINTYKVIRDKVDELILLLAKYQEKYVPMNTENRKTYFYEKRERYNILKTDIKDDFIVEKVTLFIFLNKTCFNRLYRVNKKGLFNVPMGRYKKPCICNKDNLLNVSKALQKVNIVCGSYKKSIDSIDDKTFVYIDPPYRPLTLTASFTLYTEFDFGDKE